MKKHFVIVVTILAIILVGCGDVNYNSEGDINVDDHSKKTEGQVATSVEFDTDVDVTNDKLTKKVVIQIKIKLLA